MIRDNAGTTNPALLNRLGNWRDHEAWVDFVTRYDPVIRSISSRYRLDVDTAEELCQRVWIDLARRMRSFRYDPGMTFRGWLRRLCQSRAIDLLRKKKVEAARMLEIRADERPREEAADRFDADADAAAADDDDDDDGVASARPLLLRLAEEAQDRVRHRVEERTWRVFWRISVLGQTVRDVSDAERMSYCAAFNANQRVSRMLRDEGQRLLVERENESKPDDPRVD